MQKKTLILSIVIIVIIVIIAIGAFAWVRLSKNNNLQIACTTEAKLCPDGSYVGRTGPNCEFAACLSEALCEGGACSEGENKEGGDDLWKTFSDSVVEFQYPEKLLVNFIYTLEWPPKVTSTKGIFSCVEIPQLNSLSDRAMKRMVDNRTYCISAKTGAAAGSVYTDYVYIFQKDNNLVSISFTLQYPQCLNYDEPNQSECQKEREAFDLDGVIDRIAKSVRVK